MAEFARRFVIRKGTWGRIINISADLAWGAPGEVSYRASKYALESYSRSAAAELGHLGITVNVVSPGPIQTGYMTPDIEKALIRDIPLQRIGKPEDIAHAVIFFTSALIYPDSFIEIFASAFIIPSSTLNIFKYFNI